MLEFFVMGNALEMSNEYLLVQLDQHQADENELKLG